MRLLRATQAVIELHKQTHNGQELGPWFSHHYLADPSQYPEIASSDTWQEAAQYIDLYLAEQGIPIRIPDRVRE